MCEARSLCDFLAVAVFTGVISGGELTWVGK